MSQFIFEGDFKRKPVQQLGGSSRASEQKDAVLQKAQNERKRRERDRAIAAAILTLQAYFRGCLDRKAAMTKWRIEFDSKRGVENSSSEDLVRQILLLNSFFRYREDDINRLLQLGKQLLVNTPTVTSFIKSDHLGIFSIKQLLEKCLVCLNKPKVPPAVLIRLIETYTDAKKYEESETDTLSDKTVGIVTNIWIHLLENADMFIQLREFLERKIRPDQIFGAANMVNNTDFLRLYKRIFSLSSDLRNRSIEISIKKKSYDTDSVVELIYFKFAMSFAEKIMMPVEGNSGVSAYFLIPRLAIENVMSWLEWARVIPKVIEELKDKPQAVRQIFYGTTIVFLHTDRAKLEAERDMLLKTLCALLPSIDSRQFSMLQVTLGVSKMADEIENGMEIDDPEISDNTAYYIESTILYTQLKCTMNSLEFGSWLSTFQVNKWNLIYPILCCMLRLDVKQFAINFTLLPDVCYNRDFMRSLSLYLLTATSLKDDEILAYCLLFDFLSKTLHDAEFLSGIRISKDELAKLIILLREKFGKMILMDIDTFDAGANVTLSIISETLMKIHDRNTRMSLYSEDIFISPTLSKICPVETHLLTFGAVSVEYCPHLGPLERKLLKILREFPFALSFQDRVKAWNRLLDLDKETREPNPMQNREDIQVRRKYIYEDAFEKLSPENVSDIRRHIRISLVNVVGVMEAGIDGGGLLREFLTEATKAAVDPNRGLFRYDSQNRIYPNPVAKKLLDVSFRKHFFVIGRLVGKALYEQTLLELPLAAFFIQSCVEGNIASAVDFLATLDPELHNNLLSLKTLKGDFNSLGLDFTLALDELGETRIVELKKNGRNTPVTKYNVIEYIHLVSDYKINKEMEEECRYFRAGLMDVIPTLRMFSWRELQTLISGSDRPIDVEDWRTHTNYGPGFTNNHETVELFWQVVHSFDERSLRMLLKFVTSCSRPPLLGFKDLVPKFGLQSAGKNDRLPTAATCMNLLKLPEFENAEHMKEKLLYAISAHAGFELS